MPLSGIHFQLCVYISLSLFCFTNEHPVGQPQSPLRPRGTALNNLVILGFVSFALFARHCYLISNMVKYIFFFSCILKLLCRCESLSSRLYSYVSLELIHHASNILKERGLYIVVKVQANF